MHEALLEHGFVPGDPESIMIGEAQALALDVPLPEGVALRRVTTEDDVRAMSALQDEVFGDPVSEQRAQAVLDRVSRDDGMELWVAEAGGRMVSAGRLVPVHGTVFAGIWGGVTRAAWRGRGIYRALTAARAKSALRMGATLVHSDSTEFSRPILERSGLVAVSTTTSYLWQRRAYGHRPGEPRRPPDLCALVLGLPHGPPDGNSTDSTADRGCPENVSAVDPETR